MRTGFGKLKRKFRVNKNPLIQPSHAILLELFSKRSPWSRKLPTVNVG
jgi:hypothetical protein